MFPVVYTPTEADAIAEYSHLFRRSEGLYLTPEWEDSMEEDFLDACEGRDLDLVRSVKGDETECRLSFLMPRLSWGLEIRYVKNYARAHQQGSGGIGISSAKAVIYTLAAGVEYV
jgi:malate dehydrogenase (oxaloacetate-decarboxylating)